MSELVRHGLQVGPGSVASLSFLQENLDSAEEENYKKSPQCDYRVYANRTHDPITARKFNSRNCLYSIRTEATVCNYFL